MRPSGFFSNLTVWPVIWLFARFAFHVPANVGSCAAAVPPTATRTARAQLITKVLIVPPVRVTDALCRGGSHRELNRTKAGIIHGLPADFIGKQGPSEPSF